MAGIVVTESELLEALRAALPDSGPSDAMTLQEMARATGWNERVVRRRLQALSAEGRITVHKVVRTALDGRQTTVPAYTIAPK